MGGGGKVREGWFGGGYISGVVVKVEIWGL